MRKYLLLTSITALALTAGAHVIEWDKIEHWTGEGDKKAALVIQFTTTEGRTNPGAIVWGYRWAEGTPTCEKMIRDIARADKDLVIMTQFTGDMGSTFNAAGYAPSVEDLLRHINYDFKSASADDRISFGFDKPNTGMKQTSAPGEEAPVLAAKAIEDAVTTHIIEHPFNQLAYGYPAYDYDWWQLDAAGVAKEDYFWNAGWYDGYWSYWMGTSDFDDMSYSGMGMSSTEVWDGDVHAWKYNSFAGSGREAAIDATTGATEQWLEPNYAHFGSTSKVEAISGNIDSRIEVYRLDGSLAAVAKAGERPHLDPGIYVVRQGRKTIKLIIK